MTYSTDMLNKRITIQNRQAAKMGRFGLESAGTGWTDDKEVWAAVDNVKGVSAMREGAIDVYGVVMCRCRYDDVRGIINVRSRIVYQKQVYQILGETLHIDEQENTVQFNAQMIINNGQTLSSSELGAPGYQNDI